MTRTITGSAAVLLVAAFSLLANPATAQTRDSAPRGCTGDFVCGDDPSATPAAPVESRTQERRQIKQETAAARPGTPTPVAR